MRYTRADAIMDALIFNGDPKEEVCGQCGGAGFTIEEMESSDGTLTQWEAKCECQLKDEEN